MHGKKKAEAERQKAHRSQEKRSSADLDEHIEQEVRAAANPAVLQAAPRPGREMAKPKNRLQRAARLAGQTLAKATRVANPKRSRGQQASKRPGARGVDGRAAR